MREKTFQAGAHRAAARPDQTVPPNPSGTVVSANGRRRAPPVRVLVAQYRLRWSYPACMYRLTDGNIELQEQVIDLAIHIRPAVSPTTPPTHERDAAPGGSRHPGTRPASASATRGARGRGR